MGHNNVLMDTFMNNTIKTPLLGAHISIARGFDKAVEHAQEMGCTAMQFFSKSNRQWHAKPLQENEIELFKASLASSTIRSTIIHASYLINIGSPDKQASYKAALALKEEIVRAQQLGVDHLVLHPGSHKATNADESLKQIAHIINGIFNEIGDITTKLLIETMAGQGSSVGRSFEQLAYLHSMIDHKERVGICLDTCHIFAAGYDISTQEGYERTKQAFKELLGLDTLCAIHINDSKTALGSNVDRHEHIGKGAIGIKAFECIMNDQELAHIPKIVETPLDHPDDHARNIKILKELIV